MLIISVNVSDMVKRLRFVVGLQFKFFYNNNNDNNNFVIVWKGCLFVGAFVYFVLEFMSIFFLFLTPLNLITNDTPELL